MIPGHGEPFGDIGAALERALRRTDAFEADPLRLARHAVKVVLVFALLDRERMLLAELPDYLERVGMLRDFNRRYFRVPPATLAVELVDELERVGAVRREDGYLLPR